MRPAEKTSTSTRERPSTSDDVRTWRAAESADAPMRMPTVMTVAMMTAGACSFPPARNSREMFSATRTTTKIDASGRTIGMSSRVRNESRAPAAGSPRRRPRRSATGSTAVPGTRRRWPRSRRPALRRRALRRSARRRPGASPSGVSCCSSSVLTGPAGSSKRWRSVAVQDPAIPAGSSDRSARSSSEAHRKKTTAMMAQIRRPAASFMMSPAIRWSSRVVAPHRCGRPS